MALFGGGSSAPLSWEAWYVLQVSAYRGGVANYSRYTEAQCLDAKAYVKRQQSGWDSVCVPLPFEGPSQEHKNGAH